MNIPYAPRVDFDELVKQAMAAGVSRTKAAAEVCDDDHPSSEEKKKKKEEEKKEEEKKAYEYAVSLAEAGMKVAQILKEGSAAEAASNAAANAKPGIWARTKDLVQKNPWTTAGVAAGTAAVGLGSAYYLSKKNNSNVPVSDISHIHESSTSHFGQGDQQHHTVGTSHVGAMPTMTVDQSSVKAANAVTDAAAKALPGKSFLQAVREHGLNPEHSAHVKALLATPLVGAVGGGVGNALLNKDESKSTTRKALEGAGLGLAAGGGLSLIGGGLKYKQLRDNLIEGMGGLEAYEALHQGMPAHAKARLPLTQLLKDDGVTEYANRLYHHLPVSDAVEAAAKQASDKKSLLEGVQRHLSKKNPYQLAATTIGGGLVGAGAGYASGDYKGMSPEEAKKEKIKRSLIGAGVGTAAGFGSGAGLLRDTKLKDRLHKPKSVADAKKQVKDVVQTLKETVKDLKPSPTTKDKIVDTTKDVAETVSSKAVEAKRRVSDFVKEPSTQEKAKRLADDARRTGKKVLDRAGRFVRNVTGRDVGEGFKMSSLQVDQSGRPVEGVPPQIQSNSGLMAVTKKTWTPQKKKELAPVFREPALEGSNDTALQQTFTNTPGNKMASARDLFTRLQQEAYR